MPKPKQIKLSQDDQEIEVAASSVALWEKRGWTVVDDGSTEQDPAQPVVQQPVDPATVRPEERAAQAQTQTGQNPKE